MLIAARFFLTWGLSFLLAVSGAAAQQNLGLFKQQTDIGSGVKPGFSVFIPQTGQYVITGAGANVWADHDEFQFCYKKMSGDFILYTKAEFLGCWVGYHRKVGWMVRKSLESNAPHVNTVVHGDGLTSLQFRRAAGAQTEEHKLNITKANILQLERKGNLYIMRAAVEGQEFVTDTIAGIDLGNEVYVGLFVCSHNAAVSETGVFSGVKITVPHKGAVAQHTRNKPANSSAGLSAYKENKYCKQIIHTNRLYARKKKFNPGSPSIYKNGWTSGGGFSINASPAGKGQRHSAC